MAVAIAVSAFAASAAHAALTTAPYLFSEQAVASTGRFEWDEFSGSVFAPFAPDVASEGVGSATLSASDFEAQPFDGPPSPLVTSTQNIYSGGTLIDFDIALSDAADAEANTTVVLQLSALGELTPSSFVLDGAAPTSFVDRGVAQDVLHNADEGGGEFDTHVYWAEWRVEAKPEYLVEFTHPATHLSFTQARVDYFNSASEFAAASPGLVPEPGAIGLAACGVVAALARRRRVKDATLS